MVRRYYRTDKNGLVCITPCPFFAPIKIGSEGCSECPYRVDKEKNAIICGAHETNMGIRPKMEDTSNPAWWGFRYTAFHRCKCNLVRSLNQLADAIGEAVERFQRYAEGTLKDDNET